MSRSGYVKDDDDNLHGLWRGSVERAIRGKRGQALLREMAEALDALPVKELIACDLVREDGQVCALGAVARARQLDVSRLDEADGEEVGKAFGIAQSLAREIAYKNDDDFGCYGPPRETRAQRWTRMRAWVDAQLRKASPTPSATPEKP